MISHNNFYIWEKCCINWSQKLICIKSTRWGWYTLKYVHNAVSKMPFIQKYIQCVKQDIPDWTPRCYNWLIFHLFTSWNSKKSSGKPWTSQEDAECIRVSCVESKEIYYLSQLVMMQSLLCKLLRLCADRIQLSNELRLTWSHHIDCIKHTILLSLRWLHMYRQQVGDFVSCLTFHNKACHYTSQNKLKNQNNKNIFFITSGFFFSELVIKNIICSTTVQEKSINN